MIIIMEPHEIIRKDLPIIIAELPMTMTAAGAASSTIDNRRSRSTVLVGEYVRFTDDER